MLHINVSYLNTCMLNYGEGKMRSVEYFSFLELYTKIEKKMLFLLIFLLQETSGLPIKFQIITVRVSSNLFFCKIKYLFVVL